MKMGKMMKEGWVQKVLSILVCHVEIRAVRRPGKRIVNTMMLNFKFKGTSSAWLDDLTVAIWNMLYNFPMRVRREAKKRRKVLLEMDPSPGRILQGPVFRAFAKPMLEVRMEVE